MGVIDKFLNTIKLNDDYDGFDDDYLDEEEDYEEEKAPRKRILNKHTEEEEEDEEYSDEPSASFEPSREEKQSQSSKTAASRQKQQKNPKVSPIRSSTNVRKQGGIMEVCLIKPRSMEESREITETLLENCIVILNMEGLDLDTAQRIIDFSSGSCFAIHGNLQKISDYSFLITPPGINISGDFQEMLDGTVDIPAFGTRF